MVDSYQTPDDDAPLADVDAWEDDLQRRYPEPAEQTSDLRDPHKPAEAFRDYGAEERASVKRFYQLNHRYQTVDFVRSKRAEFLPKQKRRMGIWEAMEFLNELVDDSDPDTDVPQIEHLLQTSEAIRQAGHPRWFIVTGLIHDLGKILCLFDEPQWAVVGDTFPVGCRFSPKIVYHEFFSENPDSREPRYQTECGIYERGCGLEQVLMSWGHDEYLYHVVKDYLPDEALYMIRYHSFYPAHREGEYEHLMNDRDRKLFAAVRAFNPFDLYTKSRERPNVAALRPFYEDLIAEFFPEQLDW